MNYTIDNMQPEIIQSNLRELETKLKGSFSSKDRVVVAYLFGSTARRESNCLSYIDIAVLFDNTLTKKEAFDLQMG